MEEFDDVLIWEDSVPEPAPARRRLLKLLGGAGLVMAIVVLVGAGITAAIHEAWSRYPVDGFFKHDDSSQLLKVAESVPVPAFLQVTDREKNQGNADVPSDAEVNYVDPTNDPQLCAALTKSLRDAGWAASLFGAEVAVTPPKPVKPQNADIHLTCRGSLVLVEVDGQ